MGIEADFAIYDRVGGLTALVIAKNRMGATSHWGARYRRNLIAHGTLPLAPYFLLVTPEFIFIWENADLSPEEVEPTWVIKAGPIFEKYLKSKEQIGSFAFELMVSSWLTDLQLASTNTPDELLATGLVQAFDGGRVVAQSAA